MTVERRHLLVVAPHPDDEVLGCGGLIARSVAAGERVTVCILTRGSPDVFDDALIEQGRAEARAVHAALGVDQTIFHDFPAPLLDTVARHRIADALGAIIREQAVDTVLIPHQGDIHHEHAIVHEAALVACRPVNGSPVRRIYAYETLSETEWAPPRGDAAFVPTVFVDISAYLEAKLDAMRGYASQLKEPPHPRSIDGIRALASLRGFTAGLLAAEAFVLIREVQE
jgi:LmbE family N-acetylglucosaminyl deacetylase